MAAPAPAVQQPIGERAPVPHYSDLLTSGDPGEFIARINLYQHTHHWNPAYRLAHTPLYLDGQARQWWMRRVQTDPGENWAARSNAFIEHFRGPDYAQRCASDFFRLQQKPGETVDEYQFRFDAAYARAAATQAIAMNDNARMVQWIRGLRPELRDACGRAGPEDFPAALRVARSAESYLVGGGAPIAPGYVEPPIPGEERQLREIRRMEEMLKEMRKEVTDLRHNGVPHPAAPAQAFAPQQVPVPAPVPVPAHMVAAPQPVQHPIHPPVHVQQAPLPAHPMYPPGVHPIPNVEYAESFAVGEASSNGPALTAGQLTELVNQAVGRALSSDRDSRDQRRDDRGRRDDRDRRDDRGRDRSASPGRGGGGGRGACYNCGSFEHLARDCTRRRGSMSTTDALCDFCFHRGHVLEDCNVRRQIAKRAQDEQRHPVHLN